MLRILLLPARCWNFSLVRDSVCADFIVAVHHLSRAVRAVRADFTRKARHGRPLLYCLAPCCFSFILLIFVCFLPVHFVSFQRCLNLRTMRLDLTLRSWTTSPKYSALYMGPNRFIALYVYVGRSISEPFSLCGGSPLTVFC